MVFVGYLKHNEQNKDSRGGLAISSRWMLHKCIFKVDFILGLEDSCRDCSIFVFTQAGTVSAFNTTAVRFTSSSSPLLPEVF